MTYDYAVAVLGQNVRLQVDITGPGSLSEGAGSTIRQILAREGERIAQIAAVDVRDQARDEADAARLTELRSQPAASRGHVVLQAGVKAPDGRIVIHAGPRVQEEGDR